MTDVTLYGTCGACGRDMQLVLPPNSVTVNTGGQWARCAECGHINPVRKGSNMA